MYVSVILISDGIFMIKVGRRVLIIALLLNIDFIFFQISNQNNLLTRDFRAWKRMGKISDPMVFRIQYE